MKKLLCIVLSLIMLLGIVACGNGDKETTANDGTTTTTGDTTTTNDGGDGTTTSNLPIIESLPKDDDANTTTSNLPIIESLPKDDDANMTDENGNPIVDSNVAIPENLTYSLIEGVKSEKNSLNDAQMLETAKTALYNFFEEPSYRYSCTTVRSLETAVKADVLFMSGVGSGSPNPEGIYNENEFILYIFTFADTNEKLNLLLGREYKDSSWHSYSMAYVSEYGEDICDSLIGEVNEALPDAEIVEISAFGKYGFFVFTVKPAGSNNLRIAYKWGENLKIRDFPVPVTSIEDAKTKLSEYYKENPDQIMTV